jgi:enoyl-CoA hydratase
LKHEEYETLKLETFGSVLRVTLDRPHRRNALSEELMLELLDVIAAVEGDVETSALILRGAGKGFCSGYDIAAPPSEGGGGSQFSPIRHTQVVRQDGRTFDRLWRLPIPTIAQVHGPCLAAGADLALHCDLVVCATDARIGYPAVRIGAPATHMWLYHLGPQWTKRLLLSGDSVTGTKAVEVGFALEAVAPETLDEHVLELATRISYVPRDLLTVNKHVVNRALDLMGRTLLQETAATQDVMARMASGTEKFIETALSKGFKEAVLERDAPFADGDPIE